MQAPAARATSTVTPTASSTSRRRSLTSRRPQRPPIRSIARQNEGRRGGHRTQLFSRIDAAATAAGTSFLRVDSPIDLPDVQSLDLRLVDWLVRESNWPISLRSRTASRDAPAAALEARGADVGTPEGPRRPVVVGERDGRASRVAPYSGPRGILSAVPYGDAMAVSHPDPPPDGPTPLHVPRGGAAWSSALGFLLVLLAIDGVFIAVDATAGAASGFPEMLHVYFEGGIPEWFQYSKFVIGAILMILLARKTVALYAVWGGVFAYLFADDAFMLHERVAGHTVRLLSLETAFDLPFEIWALIEPLYMVLVGLSIIVALWYVSRRSSTSMARRFSLYALALFVLLGAFAALGDLLGHWLFERAHYAEVVEDGGEMIVATLMVSLAVRQVGVELGGVRRLWAR